MYTSLDFQKRYVAVVKRILCNDRYILLRPNYHQRFSEGLSDEIIFQQARGEISLGISPVNKYNRCRGLFFDLDNKTGKPEIEAANDLFAFELLRRCKAEGYRCLLEKRGPGSYHVWVFFEQTKRLKDVLDLKKILIEPTRFIYSAPHADNDAWPKQYTAAGLPGRHTSGNGTFSQLWEENLNQWLDFGTFEFIELMERIIPDGVPDVPPEELQQAELEAKARTSGKNSITPRKQEPAPDWGTGTNIAIWIKSLGRSEKDLIKETCGGGCKAWIDNLNRIGADECEKIFDKIVAHLEEQAAKLKKRKKLAAYVNGAWQLAKTGLFQWKIFPATIPAAVRWAIDEARAEEQRRANRNLPD